MSMLSSQVEEMRDAAATYRMLGRDVLANVLYEAAESITELRDHLQHANTENTKLRELVKQMYPIAKADLQLGVVLGCKDTMSYDWALQMTELGVEVN